jgi:hypothetical protein
MRQQLSALHFISDDRRRLGALREIRARFKPGPPLLMINGCTDVSSECFEEDLRLEAGFRDARRSTPLCGSSAGARPSDLRIGPENH